MKKPFPGVSPSCCCSSPADAKAGSEGVSLSVIYGATALLALVLL